MNSSERKMAEHLRLLREEYNLEGLKAEFEGEGTRLEELCRLKEITMTAGVPITLKIGGGEALTDLYHARMIGVGTVIAPMIETEFSAKKFMDIFDRVYPEAEANDTIAALNVETITGCEHIEKITQLPGFRRIGEIAIGRVDLSRSLGLTYQELDSDLVFDACHCIFSAVKRASPTVKCILGGISSFRAFDFIRRLPTGAVDGYELRKAIFSTSDGWEKKARHGVMKGYEFEMLWYAYKREHYGKLSMEDEAYWNKINNNYRQMQRDLL